MAAIQTWSDTLLEEISGDEKRKLRALFLEVHPDYPAYVLVNSLDPLYPHKLKAVIGEYCAVHALKLDELYRAAEEEGYDEIYFLGDREELYGWLDQLSDPFPDDLTVELKRFQIQGFNFTKDLDSSIINWSTGTGKSVYGVARAKYLLNRDQVDKVIVVSKNHNKINWQRQFQLIGNLSTVIDDQASGSTAQAKRTSRASTIYSAPIFIINYEKLRLKSTTVGGDGDEIMAAVKGKRVFWIWDEMPTKMKNTDTAHYKGAQRIMRKTKKNVQVMLSATKIESNPENLYSCLKLLDSSLFPNKQKFRQMYAKSFSTFSPWQVASWDAVKLQELGMRISHMTHVANKYADPEIRAQFPKEHWEDIYIDMTEHDWKLYKEVRNGILANLSADYNTILTKMAVLQLVCNNPALVKQSQSELAKELLAQSPMKWTDAHCAKLDTLKEMLEQIDGKIVIFTMYNDFGARMLQSYIAQWGHKYVLYDGNAKKKQEAQDRFKENPDIKIFLSSDQGSDSINLQEATTVINYDLPWNYSTLQQRVNRINRITSAAEHVFYYNLITAQTMEERKLNILETKRKYEEAVDKDLGDQAEILATTSLSELKEMLKGEIHQGLKVKQS